MKIRRRLGVLATAVSGLLAAGLLFSAPAFAWDTEIKNLEAKCLPDSDKNVVKFVLVLHPSGHTGHVEADFTINGVTTALPDKDFGPDDQSLRFRFTVPGPDNDNTEITVHTKTFFEDSEETPESEASTKLAECQKEETTTSTSSSTSTTEAPTTTAAPTTTVAAPSSTGVAAPTTAGAPSTTLMAAAVSGGLPKTGSNALPMLLVALVLLVGGGAALFASRIRGRHASK